jgi:Smg protein
MNENVLDVLLFLFENYWEDELDDHASRATLQAELEAVGFPQAEIDRAFSWLTDLAGNDCQLELAPGPDTIRVYADAERTRLPAECRGFLMYLEQLGILEPGGREMVIDRAMALEHTGALDLEEIKWVTLMVLFKQPGQENTCAWVEDMLYNPGLELTH